MRHRPTAWALPVAFLAAIVLALLAVRGAGTRAPGHRASRAVPGFAAVTDATLLEAAKSPAEWVMYGRDFANTRFSPLSEINLRTVRRLRPVWVHQAGGMPDRQESTPLVADGVLYYTAPHNVVIALNVRTGTELWRYKHRLGPWSGCCGAVNRGVALYGDKVYLATLDAHLVALRRRTGEVVWDRTIAPADSGYYETMAPLAIGGRVIVGVSGAEAAIRGFIDAYDAETGARLWRFWTVPSPEDGGWWGRWASATSEGEPLHRDLVRERADSARYADAWKHGGGSVWTTPAYDPETGLLYAGVGNPSPTADSLRPGDNLYTASVVAVELATGALRWYHQLVPHDRWDYDAANPPILADIVVKGRRVPVVAHAGKIGRIYVFDRRTGQLLVRSEPLVPQFNLFVAQQGTPTLPSSAGGANWMPSTYDPRRGLMYVAALHNPNQFPVAEGQPSPWRGGMIGGVKVEGYYQVLSAVELATGKIRWQRRHGCDGVGLVTAGNLKFCGSRYGGVLKAIDMRSGDAVWEFRTGGSVAAGPVTFEVDGRQYLVVATSGGLFAFGLGAQ
jgi:alcohol dehydrogenase (cytochrome c)